jgi:hypothetical protein
VIVVVSVGLGVLCLALAFIMWWKVPDFKFGPVIQVALLITGSVGISNTFVGHWVRRTVAWVSNGLSRLAGHAVGVTVPWLLGLLVAAVVVFELAKMIKEKAKLIDDASGTVGVSAFLLPLTASAIPGPVGAWLVGGIAAICSGVTTLVASAFGMR